MKSFYFAYARQSVILLGTVQVVMVGTVLSRLISIFSSCFRVMSSN